jgi:hypothetical protein
VAHCLSCLTGGDSRWIQLAATATLPTWSFNKPASSAGGASASAGASERASGGAGSQRSRGSDKAPASDSVQTATPALNGTSVAVPVAVDGPVLADLAGGVGPPSAPVVSIGGKGRSTKKPVEAERECCFVVLYDLASRFHAHTPCCVPLSYELTLSCFFVASPPCLQSHFLVAAFTPRMPRHSASQTW